jgi:hypothetical protein
MAWKMESAVGARSISNPDMPDNPKALRVLRVLRVATPKRTGFRVQKARCDRDLNPGG